MARATRRTKRFTLDDLADDVIELMRGEHAGAAIVGCSLGGMVAQGIALKAPALVGGLVLAGTSHRQTPELRKAVEQRARDSLQGMPAMVNSTLARWFPAPFLYLNGPEVEACRRWLLEDDPVVFSWTWEAIRDLDYGDRIADINVPALLLRGEVDAIGDARDDAGHGEAFAARALCRDRGRRPCRAARTGRGLHRAARSNFSSTICGSDPRPRFVPRPKSCNDARGKRRAAKIARAGMEAWAMDKRVDQLREASNPLFGKAKLKLGTFCTNLSGGCTMSSIDGLLEADWPSTVTLAQLAEEMDFEALVPVARWKGFGGKTNFNGANFDTYTWAAGIGARRSSSAVFATSHVPTVHPVMAAKQGDDGRSHQQRPLCPQRRLRLVRARDRDVRRAT